MQSFESFGIPEGNARTIAPYALVYHFLANREDTYFQCPSRGMNEVYGGGGGGHLVFYINVEIKQSGI